MITKISKALYTKLNGDATLKTLLPSVKDGSNIWEMRMPNVASDAKFPIIVFRIRTGSQLLSVQSLNAYSWYIEIDIIDNSGSMENVLAIFECVYTLLQNADLSSEEEKAYKCRLDFFDTDYDNNTLANFVLTRWQIWSLDNPDGSVGQLS